MQYDKQSLFLRYAHCHIMKALPVLFTLVALRVSAVEPKPLLVVIEQNPWLMVIGSDSPSFALYDDGTVVCLGMKPNPDEPFHMYSVADPHKTKKDLIPFELNKLAGHYELSAATDQINTILWTPEKRIEIYGIWRNPVDARDDNDPRRKAMVDEERKRWTSLPVSLRRTLLKIDEYRTRTGQVWLPKCVEVMFWPYEYAPDESIEWPKEWPGLSDQSSKKRGKDSYSVYLLSEFYGKLRSFLKTQKEKGAVVIDGKKMAVAYRFPLPAEQQWMK